VGPVSRLTRPKGSEIRWRHNADEGAVAALLVDICQGLPPRVPSDGRLDEMVVRAVRHHRIAPLAHVALRDVRPDLAHALKPDRDLAFTHHFRVLAVLAEIEATLAGIPWLAFKGPILSELAHPLPGLRSYKDVDVLVDPRDLRAACGRLFDVGWNIIDSNQTLSRPELSGEVRVASSRRILVDLHWSMVVNDAGRQRFQVPTEALLERRTTVMAGPARIWSLELADSLVHVCLHAALSGATRLLHLIDADRLSRKIQDWDLVARRAYEWGATAQVALVLGRARRLLDTPLPPHLNAMLGLRKFLVSVLSTVDRVWPTETLTQDQSMPRLVARAVRRTATGTVASTVRNGGIGVLHRLQPKAAPVPRVPADPAAIDQYLTAVEASRRASVLS